MVQAASAGGVPSPPPQINAALQRELQHLKSLRTQDLIDQEAYVVAVTEALRVKVPGGPGGPDGLTVVCAEDAVKTSEKQLGAQVREWGGTIDAPALNKDAYLAVDGFAETDLVRKRIADLKVASALNKRASKLLLDAGQGSTPA